jgi:uncharacterized protein (DUF488 family)
MCEVTRVNHRKTSAGRQQAVKAMCCRVMVADSSFVRSSKYRGADQLQTSM